MTQRERLEPGAVRLSAFDLPLSTLLESETRELLKRSAREAQALAESCPFDHAMLLSLEKMLAYRHCLDQHYIQLIKRFLSTYSVSVASEEFGTVATEVFTPIEGVAVANRQRVLINLHGGGFVAGGRWGGQIESIPVAAKSLIKVVSIDYRLAPEHRFPAASEDVATVYRALLKDYSPQSIGIYGCSAGALLTAQVVAWLQEQGLPRPGAIGMFAAAGGFWGEGDSGHFHAARSGMPLAHVADPRQHPYFADVDPNDALAFPVRSIDRMAQFPPSLLATSTRDLALSSIVHMHSRLVALGVKADLHIWEGLDHAFHFDPDLPQSRELYAVVAKFFNDHLGS